METRSLFRNQRIGERGGTARELFTGHEVLSAARLEDLIVSVMNP